MTDSVPTVSIFGFKINPLTKPELLGLVADRVAQRQRTIMTHLNLHGMAIMYESQPMARLLSRPDVITTIDGTPVTWMGRLQGLKLGPRNRVTSLDYIDSLCQLAVEKGWRIHYVGGTEQVIQDGLRIFGERYPGIRLTGTNGFFPISGPFSAREQAILDEAAGADILIVGMGMPRQEEWVGRIETHTEVPVIITIGAMMEYFTGSLPMPPRWLGPLGLEWAFRLVTAPRRLGYRYLVEPFVLVSRMLRHPTPRGE